MHRTAPRRFAVATATAAGLLLASVAATAADPTDANATEEAIPTLAALAVCADVVDREPVGEAEAFASTVGHLWCFVDVRGAEAPTQIFHRWYVGDRLVSEIPINVRGARWRCWSKKTIRADWKGPSRVDVLTESGDVLGTAEFVLE